MKHLLFAEEIYFERLPSDAFENTPCPHGGSVSGKYSTFERRTVNTEAMVGSTSCVLCEFNRGVRTDYVKCSRRSNK